LATEKLLEELKYSPDGELILLGIPPNLRPEEKQAMKIFKNDPEIIIKPADKGGAIVIMNKEDRITEGKSPLEPFSLEPYPLEPQILHLLTRAKKLPH